MNQLVPPFARLRARAVWCVGVALAFECAACRDEPASPGVAGSPSVGGSVSGGGSAGTSAGGAAGDALSGAPNTPTGGAAASPGLPEGGAATTAGTSSGGASAGSSGEPAGGSGVPPVNAGAGGVAGGGLGPIGTGRFPFPQNTFSERCTYPEAQDPADALEAYETWKEVIVTSEGAGGFKRTRRPDSPGATPNSTVSEGIAYGMMIAVAFGDQPLFDDLWLYSQLHKNRNGLMSWYIGPNGEVLGEGGATDSDEDIAWALVMASRQWGTSPNLQEPYLDLAKAQIDRIWEHEIDHGRDDLLLPGDSWGSNVLFNPSYFAPNEYRVFAEVTGNTGWNRVIDTGYATLDKCMTSALGNAENGLAPAWCTPDGRLANDQPGNYQYDSARVPFRIGQDYCYTGEPRAKTYLAKISKFFSDIGAANIVDGYDLNGTPRPDPDSKVDGPQSAVFVGSAAVGAMHDPQFATLASEGYALVRTGELLARSTYYNMSWTALSLLMLSGNLIEYPSE